MHRNTLRAIPLAVLLGLASIGPAQAGTNTFNFDSDPSGILDLIGNAAWMPTGGNPASGGYLEITAAQGSQKSTIIFDDFDNGMVVKAFTFTCDVKTGDGTDSPADGFSINYAREGDPALISHDGNGWATGPNNEANLPEEGTQTGLAIGFDAWQSGDTAMQHGLPDGDVHYDCIGISVRVDNQLIFQKPMRTLNGAPTDPTSLQTGPRLNGDGTNPALTWQPLFVQVTEDGKVNVAWKGVTILTNLQTAYFPSRGRLIFTGRTGGAWQYQAVDNIKIITIPASKPNVAGLTLSPVSLTLKLADAGTITVNTNTIVAKINNVALTAASITKQGDTTTASYNIPNLLASGSTNTVNITFTDSTNTKSEISRDVSVVDYSAVPTSYAVPSSAIDKTKSGFLIRPYGTEENQPNSIVWTEEQLAGMHGPNLADKTGADTSGFLPWSGIIDFAIASDNQIGDFRDSNGYPEQPIPGFPGTQSRDNGTGNASLEILTYLEFPKAGMYTMGVNSDDGFKVSTGPEARDKFAQVVGIFDAGRGAADTLFNVYVAQAGIYPFRLIWENGGGGANVEWFTVLDDGTKVPINAVSNTAGPVTGALKAYRANSQKLVYVSNVVPAIGATGVAPITGLEVDLVDGDKQVDASSVALRVNGAAKTVATSKSGTVTTAKAASNGLYPPGSTNTVVLVYGDNSTPKVWVTNAWSFVVANYVSLTTDLATATGTGDATKPGFKVKMYQINPLGGATQDAVANNRNPNRNDWTDQELAGLFGTNSASLTGVGAEGYFVVTNYINWNRDAGGLGAEQGNFTTANNYPDAPIPGIPGSALAESGYDDIAAEILTFVDFPAAGFYQMGVNSDDGFKITEGDAPTRLAGVQVTVPASIAKYYGAVSTGTDNGGIARPLPRNGVISGKLVYAVPPLADADITNTNEMKGNIALMDRGTSTFTTKINRAQKAGAIAALIVNNRAPDHADGILPIVMGGNPVDPPGIPALMMTITDGAIIKAHLGEGVVVSLGADASLRLGEFNGGRGASDTIFGFLVPQAGVYPLRMTFEQGGGGANCEWFSVLPDGTKILVNDRNNPKALKAYRARTAAAVSKPQLTYSRQGSNLILTFDGRLQSSDKVDGGYTDVAGAVSGAPIPMTGPAKFYRAAK